MSFLRDQMISKETEEEEPQIWRKRSVKSQGRWRHRFELHFYTPRESWWISYFSSAGIKY